MYQLEQEEGTTIPLDRYTTVFQANVMSILQSAHPTLQVGGGRQIYVYVCSNSKSALQALENYTTKLRCHKALNNLATMMRIPKHFGVNGNIRADDHAGLGTKMTRVGPEPTMENYESINKRKREDRIDT